MKNLKTLLLLTAMLAGATSAYAASHAGAPMPMGDAKKETATAAAADMADGEIRKVDMETKKITIKHGEIKNLDMPAMQMSFRVADPAWLKTLQVGDKVKFDAAKVNGQFTITAITVAK